MRVSGLGRVHHREFTMGVGEMSEAAFTFFLEKTPGAAAAICRDGANAFICTDWRHMGELLAADVDRRATVASLLATAKLNGVEPYAYLKDVLERRTHGHPTG